MLVQILFHYRSYIYINGNEGDINFEDFKLQENSVYWELRNEKNGNEIAYFIA
ncbi:hypothetical protein [Borreliella bissettiae]|uniref:Uncharacterized domain protein n=1 Tax=Borrelia bissettiae (strain DSM 17990 / CIP 109136 / DN127) TaxID=521010 RepID=G0ANP4_BORBD|nr:hypothetical protein [Borreliella bissettiae]AEL19320.1 putative uncharacterized domain protein [Borreliella bissettiae DN127]